MIVLVFLFLFAAQISPVGGITSSIATDATPTFSPGAGTYSSTQSVTISTVTSGATICYTTNGTTPTATVPGTCDGTTYSTPLSVSTSQTIKAIATKILTVNSAVGSAAYIISAGITFGGHTTCHEVSGTCTTPTINTTGATLFVVGANAASFPTSCTTASPSNTLTQLTGKQGTNQGGVLYYLYAPSTGTAMTLTCNGTRQSLAFEWFSGTAGSSVDQQNGAIDNTGTDTTIQPGSITPGHNNEVSVVFYSYRNNSGGSLSSVGAGNAGDTCYSSNVTDSQNFLAATYYGFAMAYCIQTTAIATNPLATLSVAPSDMTAVIASFQ